MELETMSESMTTTSTPPRSLTSPPLLREGTRDLTRLAPIPPAPTIQILTLGNPLISPIVEISISIIRFYSNDPPCIETVMADLWNCVLHVFPAANASVRSRAHSTTPSLSPKASGLASKRSRESSILFLVSKKAILLSALSNSRRPSEKFVTSLIVINGLDIPLNQ